jgi:rsbT co-antagonist protein RsbR
VNLSNVITKATLADAFVIALQRTGKSISNGALRAEALGASATPHALRGNPFVGD